MGFTIDRIDHIVLNCRDVNVTADWYQRALGMRSEPFGPDGRIALKFGNQKITCGRPTHPIGRLPPSMRQGRSICASSPLIRLLTCSRTSTPVALPSPMDRRLRPARLAR